MAESKRSIKAAHDAVTELQSSGSAPGDIGDPDAEVAAVPAAQRYEIRSSLGEGGMGEVRLCRDRVIGRDVALKVVLRARASHGDFRARFVREARVQGQLEHPAIVPVYDFGVDEAGQPFFTMKRVRGVTLERAIEGLRRGDEAMARLYTKHKLLAAFVQVCLAVDFAHERGVIHRDLKPANVMLGGHGEVYVLDWGVAKVRSASRTLDPKVPAQAERQDVSRASQADVDDGTKSAPTAAGAMLGTPGYMPPEQIRGDEVDARSDVYTLGAILFELLTYEVLHTGASIPAMMKRTLEGVDARASSRAPQRDVAPELEAICVRACALDPRERPRSARELADAIEAYLSGDRDLALRKTLAKVHLARARDAAARARVPSAPSTERTDALRELGRAVALDPQDDATLELLVAMLTEVPKEPPPEVREAVEAARAASAFRIMPRVASFYMLSSVLFLPLQLYLGVVDAWLVALPIVGWLIAGGAMLVVHRFYPLSSPARKSLIALAAMAIAATSLYLGPLLLLPSLIVMSTMGTIL
jgi:serine/threonine protein kinase